MKQWDVFISHASEDKMAVARPLAEGLRERGYKVWYDEFSLRLGDSLRRSIDSGIAESRYGIVILSKHFFAKHWPNQELNGLAAIEVGGKEVILPVWHGLSHADVARYSPILADKKAVSTKDGIERVIRAIDAVLNSPIARGSQDELRSAEKQVVKCGLCEGTGQCFKCGGDGRVAGTNKRGEEIRVPCRNCVPPGTLSLFEPGTGLCQVCGGKGSVVVEGKQVVRCGPCEGRGRCPKCDGGGRVVGRNKCGEEIRAPCRSCVPRGTLSLYEPGTGLCRVCGGKGAVSQ